MGNPLSEGALAAARPQIGREGIEAYAAEMNAAHPDAPVRWSVGPGMNAAGKRVECLLHVTWKRSGLKAW